MIVGGVVTGFGRSCVPCHGSQDWMVTALFSLSVKESKLEVMRPNNRIMYRKGSDLRVPMLSMYERERAIRR